MKRSFVIETLEGFPDNQEIRFTTYMLRNALSFWRTGAIYQAFQKLEAQSLIHSDWDTATPRRRIYWLSEEGLRLKHLLGRLNDHT